MSETTFNINGITCNSCVTKLKDIYSNLNGVEEVFVDKSSGQVVLKGVSTLNRQEIEKVIQAHPKYSLATSEDESSSSESFKPLIIVIGFILLLVTMSQLTKGAFDWRESMRLFMAGFFIAFSFFKFLDLQGFAKAYQTYDIIARRWKAWGFVYPFIELSLGLFFLFDLYPFYANVITLLVLGISSIGVVQAVLSKKKIKCACLGTGFNLPMTTVTIIEDVSMVFMSIIMLITM